MSNPTGPNQSGVADQSISPAEVMALQRYSLEVSQTKNQQDFELEKMQMQTDVESHRANLAHSHAMMELQCRHQHDTVTKFGNGMAKLSNLIIWCLVIFAAVAAWAMYLGFTKEILGVLKTLIVYLFGAVTGWFGSRAVAKKKASKTPDLDT